MEKLNFKTGEKVRLKGRKGSFRYVKNNIVQEISTGHMIGVTYDRIRKDSNWLRDLCGLLKALFV